MVRQSHFQNNLIRKSNINAKNYIFADNYFTEQIRVNFSLRADTNLTLLIIDVYFNHVSPAVFEIWQFNEKLALITVETLCSTVRRHYFQITFSYFKLSKTPTTFWKVQDFYLQKNFFTSHLAQSTSHPNIFTTFQQQEWERILIMMLSTRQR